MRIAVALGGAKARQVWAAFQSAQAGSLRYVWVVMSAAEKAAWDTFGHIVSGASWQLALHEIIKNEKGICYLHCYWSGHGTGVGVSRR